MSFRLRFEVPGDQAAQLDRTLMAISGFPDDVLDPGRRGSAGSRIAELFREMAEEQIESEGARGGRPFAPLSPDYARTKAEGLGILVSTGGLREALTRRGGDHYERFSGGELELGLRPGSEVHQRAIYHQAGTRRMPSRPPVVLTETDKRQWTREVLADLRRRLRR